MERGPSPLMPSLFLLCLGFLIFWPIYAFIHLPSSFPFGKSSYGTNHHLSISSHDYVGFEFGFGTLLFL
ncbi:hypothetical protein CR513_23982, partial [Mucuna pruriens]